MSTSQKDLTGDVFSDELIFEQLQKIFSCPVFSVSEILRRFLTYITQETLAGRANTIKEYTIAVNVLNKPTGFKPQQDAIVRIHAGRLRRALHYYYKEFGVQDQIELSIPKGSYLPVFRKMQPQKSSDDPVPSAESFHAESLNLIVLPFRTLETDISRLSFADSLGVQLSAGLAGFPDFSVVSYYTTRRLSTRKKGIQELVELYGVHYVVTGNVQFENKKLRVTVQLTDAQTGAQVWTEIYNYSFAVSGLFATSDEIVCRILAALGDFNGIIIQQFSRKIPNHKTDQSLSTMLGRYQDFYADFNESSFKKTHAFITEVVKSNPLNDMAWALLGQLSLLGILFNHTSSENPLIMGLRCARKALKINPLCQHGYISLAMAQICLDNRQGCLDALENARKQNPNASGQTGIIGCLLISAGEFDRGLALLEESMEMNKYFPSMFYLFTSLYYFKQADYGKALEEIDKTGMSGEVLNILLRASIYIKLGRKKEAEMLARSSKGYPFNRTWLSREFISRFLLDGELVDRLCNGFRSVHLSVLTVA
jgi:adenylate cyclase